MWTPISDL